MEEISYELFDECKELFQRIKTDGRVMEYHSPFGIIKSAAFRESELPEKFPVDLKDGKPFAVKWHVVENGKHLFWKGRRVIEYYSFVPDELGEKEKYLASVHEYVDAMRGHKNAILAEFSEAEKNGEEFLINYTSKRADYLIGYFMSMPPEERGFINYLPEISKQIIKDRIEF